MDLSKLSVNKLRTELWTCHILSEQRCLRKTCEWAEDLLFALPEEGEEKLLTKLEKELNDVTLYFNPHFDHARSCFELNEYDRAADIVRNSLEDDRSRFLHYFSKYKAAEKKRVDLMNEVSVNMPKKAMSKFNELRDSLERSMDKREPDGWLLYVYALVLYKFRLQRMAIEVVIKAITLTPINWAAWYFLSTLVDSKETLNSLDLPNHFFRVFFYLLMRQELDISLDDPWVLVGQKETKNFLDKYFSDSLFIKTLMAKSYSYQTDKYKEAMDMFSQIRSEDPFRIDAMDIYSNLLYVKKLVKDLSKLAYDIERIDPFTTEANCCIANSFSAREQHTKAIVYFTRSLRLNPDHLNSWTLIGHEYLEMKSIDKAMQAYRFSISINKRDCRAWLGLGNTFETVISSPNVNARNYEPCLYYYSQVRKYRPNDNIMFMAMGSIFEKMGEHEEALLCHKRSAQSSNSNSSFKGPKLNESDQMRV